MIFEHHVEDEKYIINFILFLTWKNKSNISNISLQYLFGFKHAYNIVLHKFSEKLYLGLVAAMTLHLKGIAKSVEAAQGCSFLKELNRKWNDNNKALLIGALTHFILQIDIKHEF